MSEIMNLLLSRRSVVARKMGAPGPNDDELAQVLRAGARVPDHGKLAPWRFIVIRDDDRARLGAVLAGAIHNHEADVGAERVALEADRFMRAPIVVCVVSTPRDGKVPEWEQVLSAGAVCQNMLIATHALGYVGQWLTEWYAYDGDVRATLGVGADERIAGFIYMGSATEAPSERQRPVMANIVSAMPPAHGPDA